ncbi:MAG: acyl-CoA dehydrogenase family protein [Gordonia sp.]|jgi:alkylation response protein AidB-like acyl-CoA dehydrogenase|uniref:acyl-CoA dehydrogenase family protein n=1 Tax=Gordonia sp. (in: high G+C Gram-positive bacteria) TaxID=84139 RepID=UPI001DFE0C62|nr:acyl-CoA dehydrogenase family protein [Gordonia sp. (in: high G+C Gram-positive bacteria)]MCB1297303.1 acyl-CoA dehydrogenase family protein [Gordonia sp. (in: high G+C Gram-positive bacteria)]HQV17750.1 acyl-CoA dehydrogenase family protein [Gordonia sp. (in: high G+C Gram-positive bacteria)]
MRRKIFEPEHDDFRATARSFFLTECVPHSDEWEERGYVDRDVWLKAGELGLIGWEMPEEFGGADIQDFRFNAILNEEYHATGAVGIGLGVQNDILSGYFRDLTTEEQKKRWLPKYVSGEYITAIAMSEPGAGSDLANVKTSARRDGDHYVINGAKTFISNGLLADLVVVACRTDPDAEKPHKGISLIVVETGMEGFTRGRKLDKIGQKSADTAELFFDNVRVPVENLLGEENRGFYQLMRNLPAERLGIAIHAVAQARRAVDLATSYAHERKAFGQEIGKFQVNRHALAQMRVEVDVMQTYVDQCILDVNSGELTAEEAAGAKWWATETQWKIVDRCLQLHGGYGYMNEYEIARLWRDARVQRIYGGTNEIMLDLIGRKLGF